MLTLSHSTVSGNLAHEKGGAIHNKDGGTTTIEDASVISGNTATFDGGAINNWDGTVTLSSSTISGNASGASGGGVYNLDILTVTGSALQENNSLGDGDAIYSDVGIADATRITGSCIVGNGEIAVFNNWPALQAATGNWWGDLSGPTHPSNPAGTGDTVSDNVDFSYWLEAPPPICTSE